ncbi:hypothetical protein PICMEDRAFT_64267 [Pichia membranifaciens NRRL Y-2026]|uniref:Uncharacterized protein n=1 Tax=Pichia membranifaciens NRRL Y-2026 TaxID=763406 RepID=A0A1E3NIH4_9ASCO|nr:hypothetical protein PICMEDRAFT_64267 [Pichia membranifaciens NRRL Y-2026]ODQ45911.1 hypothetical protein PICMEDRAFT_64267 [Pichia membranifaciens NRRL Y-2026]
MKFPEYLLQKKFPSYAWCVFLLSTFSFYCYRNIFLQSEIGFKLPTINLVSALNHFDVFVVLPSTERFDLYVNLAKTFEAYKEDYLEHYKDYILLLNSYLILGESQIALKYYAYKYYLNDEYKETDSFVLGSPIVEFNQNFNNPVELSTNREHNLINKHYHNFGIKNNKESCEMFFNDYIFPLYKSQSSWKEVEVAKAMSTILNQWTLAKRLQIVCFIGSLILIALSLLCFTLSKTKPNILMKSVWGYVLVISYFLVFAVMLVLTFVCLSITIVTYRSNLNFKGLHNTSFNVLQLAWLCFIEYISLSWVVNFKIKNDALDREKELDNENDSLKGQLLALLKTSLSSQDSTSVLDTSKKDAQTGGVKDLLNSGFNAVRPILTTVKRLMTPGKELLDDDKTGNPSGSNSITVESYNGPTMEDIERIIQYTNNQSNLNTAAADLNEVPAATKEIPIDQPITTETKKNLSKEPFTNFKALNVVSAISTSHPDCSPFTKSSATGSPDYKFDVRSSKESISKSLEEKRAGFYQHAGYLLSTKSDGESFISEKPPRSELSSKLYYKKSSRSPLTRSSINSGNIHYELNTKSEDVNINSGTTATPDTNIEWEKKFGLSSAKSNAETVQVTPSGETRSHHSAMSSKYSGREKVQSPKQLASGGTIKSSPKRKIVRDVAPKERSKSKYEFFLPSTGATSEYTDTSVAGEEGMKVSSSAEEIDPSTASVRDGDQQESVFSIDRIVREQSLKQK